MNKRGFSQIIVLLIVAVVLALGAPTIFRPHGSSSSINKTPDGWKTYQDPRYWYEVSYPGYSSVVVESMQPNSLNIAGIDFWSSFYYQDPGQYALGTPITIGFHTWHELSDGRYALIEDGELIQLNVSPAVSADLLHKILSTFRFVTIPGQQRLDKYILSLKNGDTVGNFKVTGNGGMGFDGGGINSDAGSVGFAGQFIVTGDYSLEGMDGNPAFSPDATTSAQLPEFDRVDTFPGGTYFDFGNRDVALKQFGDYRGPATIVVDNLFETVTPQYRAFNGRLVGIISPPPLAFVSETVLPTSTSISWSDAVTLMNACQVKSFVYANACCGTGHGFILTLKDGRQIGIGGGLPSSDGAIVGSVRDASSTCGTIPISGGPVRCECVP